MNNKEFIRDYVAASGLMKKEDIICCEEIGDGNINFVYRVSDRGGFSVIVKNAQPTIRTSGNPLSVSRMEIEVTALKKEYELTGHAVPKVYAADMKNHLFVMEDLKDYENLRYALCSQKVFPDFARHITEFLARSLILTTDAVMDPMQKKQLVKEMINPMMCQITERLVFTEPYTNAENTNILPDNAEYYEKLLYQNQTLKLEAAHLKSRFMCSAQSLIHGDLHSGSIFVNTKEIKVLDPEFAFFGPAGYDVGNVLANLIFPWTRAVVSAQDWQFVSWLEETIANVLDLFCEKSIRLLIENTRDPMFKSEGYAQALVKTIAADTIGMTGTELIRRIVGDSKVADITSIQDKRLRSQAERICVNVGIELILNHRIKTMSGKDVLEIMRKAHQKEREPR